MQFVDCLSIWGFSLCLSPFAYHLVVSLLFTFREHLKHIRRMCSVQDSVLPQGVGLRKPHITLRSSPPRSFLLSPRAFLLTPHFSPFFRTFLAHLPGELVDKSGKECILGDVFEVSVLREGMFFGILYMFIGKQGVRVWNKSRS